MGLLYSSGTTGRPKGAAISHNAMLANLQMLTHPEFIWYRDLGGVKTNIAYIMINVK